eukprot:IDg3295t1
MRAVEDEIPALRLGAPLVFAATAAAQVRLWRIEYSISIEKLVHCRCRAVTAQRT